MYFRNEIPLYNYNKLHIKRNICDQFFFFQKKPLMTIVVLLIRIKVKQI